MRLTFLRNPVDWQQAWHCEILARQRWSQSFVASKVGQDRDTISSRRGTADLKASCRVCTPGCGVMSYPFQRRLGVFGGEGGFEFRGEAVLDREADGAKGNA